MIAVARTSLAGSARRAATSLIPGPDGSAGPADPAGQLLGRLSVLPALLVLAWLLAGLPLLLLGWFTPLLTLLISVPLAAVLVPAGLRWIPGLRQESRPARRPGPHPPPGRHSPRGPGGRRSRPAARRPRAPPGGPWPQ